MARPRMTIDRYDTRGREILLETIDIKPNYADETSDHALALNVEFSDYDSSDTKIQFKMSFPELYAYLAAYISTSRVRDSKYVVSIDGFSTTTLRGAQMITEEAQDSIATMMEVWRTAVFTERVKIVPSW